MMSHSESAISPRQVPRHRRRLLGLAAVLTALIALAASAAGGATAARSTAPASEAAKPTVVMVHGAWADGSGWNKVVARLQRDGYPVRVPPNPLRGLGSDAAYLASFLSTISGPIVLVGHSYGGAVITNAATGDTDVKALVYVDAFAPDEGETLLQLIAADSDSALNADPTSVFDFVPYPGAPPGDADLYLKQPVFLESFSTGISTPKAMVLYATQRPLALFAGAEPSGVPAWKTIPSWYLVGTGDQIITATAQRFMAERAAATIVEVKAGHLSMISDPAAVTKLINQAANATT
jgi:pimeloyl-ACP methyl ester carboxylesterase